MFTEMPSFIFGGSTGDTPATLSRRRAIAEALASGASGRAPRDVGEGLTAIGQALAFRALDKRNTASELAGQEHGAATIASLLAGRGGGADATVPPVDTAPTEPVPAPVEPAPVGQTPEQAYGVAPSADPGLGAPATVDPAAGVDPAAAPSPPAAVPPAQDAVAQEQQTADAGPSLEEIVKASNDPWLSDSQRAVVNELFSQEMKKRDPAYKMGLEKSRLELDVLKRPPKTWQKLDDNTLFNPADGTTQQVDGGAPLFQGTGLDAQAWNILQTTDPSSKEYATAYSIVSQPKTQLVQTENGMMPVEVPPQLPAWLKAPGAAGGPVAAPGAVPAPSGAPAAQPAADAGVIPGTKKPKTEAQGRNATIATLLESEVPTLNQNWSALSDPTGQLLSALPTAIGNPWQSEEYQRAAYSVMSAATNILYSLSGASSNPGETVKQGQLLMPQFGDKPGAVADKLNRFKAYVKGVAIQSGDPALMDSVNKALEGLTGQPAADVAAPTPAADATQSPPAVAPIAPLAEPVDIPSAVPGVKIRKLSN